MPGLQSKACPQSQRPLQATQILVRARGSRLVSRCLHHHHHQCLQHLLCNIPSELLPTHVQLLPALWLHVLLLLVPSVLTQATHLAAVPVVSTVRGRSEGSRRALHVIPSRSLTLHSNVRPSLQQQGPSEGSAAAAAAAAGLAVDCAADAAVDSVVAVDDVAGVGVVGVVVVAGAAAVGDADAVVDADDAVDAVGVGAGVREGR